MCDAAGHGSEADVYDSGVTPPHRRRDTRPGGIAARLNSTLEEQARTLPGLLVSTGGVRDWADPQLCCIRRRTSRTALRLIARDALRNLLTVFVPCTLRPRIPLTSLSKKGAEAVVSVGLPRRRLPERGWNLDAADTKERKVRSPPTGLEAGGP